MKSLRVLESYCRVTPESAEHGDFSECEVLVDEFVSIADGLRALKSFIYENGYEENSVGMATVRIYGNWFDTSVSKGETEQRCFDLDFRKLTIKQRGKIQRAAVRILRGEK